MPLYLFVVNYEIPGPAIVYVDEEHVQKFNNFIQQYPSFKFEELNL